MCGVVGIVGKEPVNQAIYDALTVLQHRGQDSAGIATCDQLQLHIRRGNGLVRDVFKTVHMQELSGNTGIGHVRYPTAGSSRSSLAQPFYVNSPYGIALAHNGNLVNAAEVKKELFLSDRRHINTDSDSEVLLNALAHELQQSSRLKLDPEDVFDAVTAVHRRCLGGYAVVAMIIGQGMLAFRDPNGIRPIVFGERETAQGKEYMVASESVALDASGYRLIRDIRPGEAVFIGLDGSIHTRLCAEQSQLSPCLFEFVYLARPDSIIDGISVYKARLRMGKALAAKIARDARYDDIDVVIPIPDTSRTSALSLANELGKEYREGFIKNRYIGRTFIMPGQKIRKKSVRQKLNAIGLEFRGKNVLLVDDSIVRGTTSQQIIQMAREAGARKVYFASAAPPVRYANVYGIDMPSPSELIAHGRDEDEVCEAIGADGVIYQELQDLIDSITDGRHPIARFDASCFDGNYITPGVTERYLNEIDSQRNDHSRQRHLISQPVT
ncbi:MAG: amidophosphoribosyltransferase [Gammaproteobacteria bacterium]|nr:MAG: amidophosphoribosyltransferase [Gammaproteobacteria bacterium]